jgi:threonine/homoserine/homoserine lactone efflux protein
VWNIFDKKTVYQILFGVCILLGVLAVVELVLSILFSWSNIVLSGFGVLGFALLAFGAWWKIKQATQEESEANEIERQETNGKNVETKKNL